MTLSVIAMAYFWVLICRSTVMRSFDAVSTIERLHLYKYSPYYSEKVVRMLRATSTSFD